MIFEILTNNYLFLFLFLLFVVSLSAGLFAVSYFTNPGDQYFEKISAYECGFEPFEDTRVKFDVRVYLVGILFLVFDIEIMFMYPWVVCFSVHSVLAIFSMFIFLIILVLGFVYE